MGNITVVYPLIARRPILPFFDKRSVGTINIGVTFVYFVAVFVVNARELRAEDIFMQRNGCFTIDEKNIKPNIPNSVELPLVIDAVFCLHTVNDPSAVICRI